MKKRIALEITEQEAFVNWLNSLTGEQAKAWSQDMDELAGLIGIVGEPMAKVIPEEDKPRCYPLTELVHALWMIHQSGYPLPVLQSLREGKEPGRP